MGYADRFLDTGPSRQELHAALLGSALQFGETVRRFEHRCRARSALRSIMEHGRCCWRSHRR